MSKERKFSRREFARRAALTVTAAAVLPSDLLAQSEKGASPVKPSEKPQQPSTAQPVPPELSPAAKAEAQASYNTLMQKYGDRFTDEQKKDIGRLLEQQQKSIEAVRAFALENGDEPATVLRLYTGGSNGAR